MTEKRIVEFTPLVSVNGTWFNYYEDKDGNIHRSPSPGILRVETYEEADPNYGTKEKTLYFDLVFAEAAESEFLAPASDTPGYQGTYLEGHSGWELVDPTVTPLPWAEG